MNFKMDLRKAQGIGGAVKLQGDASVKATDKAKKPKPVKKPESKLEVIVPRSAPAPAPKISTIGEEPAEEEKKAAPAAASKPIATDDATVTTVETSGSSSTTAAAGAPAKVRYIPPHLRKKMEEEAAGK
jgi:alpha-beta hydrolase superfamily lysophospholipase